MAVTALEGLAPWPRGESEMARRVREHDWTATELGAMEHWPPSLKAIVDLLLPCGFPMIVLWGPDLVQIYNDGYRDVMGAKHPWGLGRPTSECWPEVWHINGPIYDRVRAGETVNVTDGLYPLARNGELEDVWFTLSYSPVRDEAGGIAGVLVTLQETTHRILAERGRAEAEASLRESEARFRAFVTASSDVIYRMSPDWAELRQLEARNFLRDADGPSSAWTHRYIHPEDQAVVHAAIAHAIRTKSMFELQHRVIRADGSPGWTLSRAVPLLTEEGEIKEWFGAASDITAIKAVEASRARSEALLRESEERQSFLLRLSDALRPLADPAAIKLAAMGVLGEHLGVTRAQYYDADDTGEVLQSAGGYSDGVPPVVEQMRISDFGSFVQELHQDAQTIAVADVLCEPRLSETELQAYAALGLRAFVSVPLVKEGRLVATLGLHHASPRQWSDAEIGLAEETAERTWAAVERALAEAALRESEARLAAALEALPVGIGVIDADGKYILSNQEMDRFMPARVMPSRDEARRWRWRWRAWHPDGRPVEADDFPDARALRGHRTVPGREMLYTQDGVRQIWTSFAAVPLHNEQGRVTGLVTVVADIDDLKRSEERFRTLAEGMPQLVWRSAEGGAWTWASPQWLAYTGLSAAGSRGHGWLAALHPADREIALAAWEAATSEGLFQAEFRIRHGESGQYGWFQTRGAPVPDGRGGIAEWLGTSTDIDTQVDARVALFRSQEELEAQVAARTVQLEQAVSTLRQEARERAEVEERLRQSEKLNAIGQLTGGIAHDFNNTIQGVVGGITMARRKISQGQAPGAASFLDMAQEAAARAAGLTRRLLAFARQQRLEPKLVDVDELVAGLSDLIRRTVGPEITVELRLREAAVWVLCDPSELESAILNLCINARDAMPEGGRLMIRTEERRLAAEMAEIQEALGPCAAISVTDTGMGMPAEVLARVFEPFFTTKPQGQGTGLGLSQVYGFVRQSGGTVRIESTPGQGTTAHLLLPLHQGEVIATTILPPAPSLSAKGNGTILLVDDEDLVRQTAATRLRECGYKVVEARNGAEALRILDDASPDLLITDVGLPGGMNGRQVAEAVRERIPTLPVLFITGYAGTALPPGIEVIDKPFELDVLTQRVEAIMKSRQQKSLTPPSA